MIEKQYYCNIALQNDERYLGALTRQTYIYILHIYYLYLCCALYTPK